MGEATTQSRIQRVREAVAAYVGGYTTTPPLSRAIQAIPGALKALEEWAAAIELPIGPIRSVLTGTGVVNTFSTTPTIDSLSIFDAGAGLDRLVAISLAAGTLDIRGAPLRAPNGLPFSLGLQTLDVSGSGTIALGAGQIECASLLCTGALSGTRLLTIPPFAGGLKYVTNASTGTQLFGVNCRLTPYASANGIAYLAPGQTKAFRSDGTLVFGINPEVFTMSTDISLAFPDLTVTDTEVCLTPPNFQLLACTALQLVATAGGTSTRRMGVTVGGNELLLDYTNPAPPLQGKLQGQLGSDMATDFNAFYGTSVIIRHRSTASGGAVTLGTDRPRVIGIVQGN